MVQTINMKKFPRERSKSLGHILLQPSEVKKETVTKDENDIRLVCRRLAPYISHEWRDVCRHLSVSEEKLDELSSQYKATKRSELAFQGLCSWLEMAGRFASRDKLLMAVRACGLRRAQDELTPPQDNMPLPCFAKAPAVVTPVKDASVNKQAKQKAAADRLARPKSRHSDSTEHKPARSQQRRPSFIADSPLLTRPVTSKHTELGKVKIKVSVNGVQRKGAQEVESTRDTFASTKDDYKHICHTFVRLVMANQQSHFNQLKHRLGYKGIAVLGLDKLGFNIFLHVVCFNLGCLEALLQSYSTDRLQRILHTCLVTQDYLDTLNVADLDIAVHVDEDAINRNREVIINRNFTGDVFDHSIDAVVMCKSLLDHDSGSDNYCDMDDPIHDQVTAFELRPWYDQLKEDIEGISDRLRAFLSNVNDFLLTLRILKPADKSVISCLQDVIECYHRIKSTKHLHEGTHSVVVNEYLAICNQIRLKVRYIHRYECALAFNDLMTDPLNELFQCHLHELDEMLEPRFEFEHVLDEMALVEPGLPLQTLCKDTVIDAGNAVPISSIERDAYGGCLSYIAELVGALCKVGDVIDTVLNYGPHAEPTHRNVTILGEAVVDKQTHVKPVLVPLNHRTEQSVV